MIAFALQEYMRSWMVFVGRNVGDAGLAEWLITDLGSRLGTWNGGGDSDRHQQRKER